MVLQLLDSQPCDVDLIQDSIQHVFGPLPITQDAGADLYPIGQRAMQGQSKLFLQKYNLCILY